MPIFETALIFLNLRVNILERKSSRDSLDNNAPDLKVTHQAIKPTDPDLRSGICIGRKDMIECPKGILLSGAINLGSSPVNGSVDQR